VSDDRPLILVVEQDFRDLKPMVQTLAVGRFRLATCPVESVALEFVAERRPKAVLLDAHALYLEGAACLARWNAASPETRVLFLDADGPWCLIMELPGADPAEVTINPCAAQQLATAIDELLSRAPAPGRRTTEVCNDRLADLAV
jgi:DNA-binding NtrC family response regulator